jgi:hypothetical protein
MVVVVPGLLKLILRGLCRRVLHFMRHTLAQQAPFRDDVEEICVITTGDLSYNLITEVSGWESVDLIYLA